jgi:hypothetical protein
MIAQRMTVVDAQSEMRSEIKAETWGLVLRGQIKAKRGNVARHEGLRWSATGGGRGRGAR